MKVHISLHREHDSLCHLQIPQPEDIVGFSIGTENGHM